MTDVLANVIDEKQTAYLKGRMINDNVRSMLSAINLANRDDKIDGLFVSLDAKKAFDSVEHSYIEKCLEKFGLGNFIPIFKLLYSDLRTDIIINGVIISGFCINRGVKQGDALSCILFVLCMEPLLRNIQGNPLIRPIISATLDITLPKVFGYADDVSPIINNDQISIEEVFHEYERLTRKSGLELNASKTEIMRLSVNNDLTREYKVKYLNREYSLGLKKEIKVNGIIFQMNETDLKDTNVAACIQRMDKYLRSWSQRSLSILGKILILKTYGVSQFIYLCQSMTLNDNHFKRINHSLYKFVWNKHYSAAKAPERIKRDIVNTPIHMGGFGMLDVRKLDDSLKLRALGRLLVSKHPMLIKIKDRLKLDDFFFPKIDLEIDQITVKGVELLMKARQDLLGNHELEMDRFYCTNAQFFAFISFHFI
jgi:hypothetical protein